jgi:hypothetical protein
MENYQEKFNEIVENNFTDPTEDYYAIQYSLYLNTGECLLTDTQLDILSDEQIRLGDLSSAYGIKLDIAKMVYEYIEQHKIYNKGEDNLSE